MGYEGVSEEFCLLGKVSEEQVVAAGDDLPERCQYILANSQWNFRTGYGRESEFLSSTGQELSRLVMGQQ